MSAIIFDFDGTIADSFDYVVDFLIDRSKQKVDPSEKQELRHQSMVAIARTLGFSRWRWPGLFLSGRRLMSEAINKVQPFKGMPEVIKKLHAEGHELFIVSSNDVHNVHRFLSHHALQTYFLETYGGIGLFGKAPALRRLIKEHNLDINQAVYIGDELRDVEAAQSIKLPVVAVSWGFARTVDLVDLKPTALAKEPAELISILNDI